MTAMYCQVRECNVHPIDSRLISANKDNVVEVWDYFSQECSLSKSLHDILQTVPLKTSSTSHQYAQQLTTQQGHALLNSNLPTSSIQYPINDFIQSRQSRSSKSLHFPVDANYHSSPQIASALLSSQDYDTHLHQQSERDAAERSHLLSLQLHRIGDIKRVSFIDREAIRWTCGIYSQAASKASKSPLFSQSQPSETPAFAAMSTTFHSSQCIMLVCDAAIVFHDMQTKRSSAITTLDFGATKAFPTAAEFIYPELCAIGCSDGSIRIWDCLQWKLVKTLNSTSRSPIHSLKNLLPKNYFSVSGRELPSKDGHGRMRLLSTQSDGSSLIWESEIFGNIILIGDDDPTGFLTPSSGIRALALVV
jgi:WD40 repeat protein